MQQGKKKERKKTCHPFEFPQCFFVITLSLSLTSFNIKMRKKEKQDYT
jgi:hypothetical protein